MLIWAQPAAVWPLQDGQFHPHINPHSLSIMRDTRGASGSHFLERVRQDIAGRKNRLKVG